MVSLTPTPQQEPEIPDAPFRFLRQLWLDDSQMARMGKISAETLSGKETPGGVSLTQKTITHSREKERQELLNLIVRDLEQKCLGRSERPTRDKTLQSRPFKRPLEYASETLERCREIADFIIEIQYLIADPEVRNKIVKELISLKAHQEEQGLSVFFSDASKFNEKSREIQAVKENIAALIVDYVNKERSRMQVYQGVKILADQLRGCKVRAALNSAADTNALLDYLKENLETLMVQKVELNDPKMRRELFRHLTYLRENTPEIAAIEKTRQPLFSKLFLPNERVHLESKCTEIRKLVDQFYQQLNYNDDEVASFRDLSVEAYQAKRVHLIMIGNDLLEGAENLCLQKIKEAEGDTKKLEACYRFLEKLQSYREKNLSDPAIGNGSPHETLSANFEEFVAEQKAAKEALQVIFDGLKRDLAEMMHPGVELTDEMLNQAKKALNKARHDHINQKERWEVPIVRHLETPPGTLPSQQGKVESLSFVHTMSCLNQGYSSMANRGRVAGPECPQPNFHQVVVQGSGRQTAALCDYSSAAINVEFYQLDDTKRMRATEHQTLEILMTKAVRAWNELSEEEKGKFGTKEAPLVVQSSVVTLLTPDVTREWLLQNQSMINKVLHAHPVIETMMGAELHVDPSVLERRMLEESVRAYESFDETSSAHEKGEKFSYKDQEGNLKQVTVDTDGTGKITYVIPVPGKSEGIHVQFDVAYFNVGTNKVTAQMESCALGMGLESLAKVGKSVLETLRVISAPLDPTQDAFNKPFGNQYEHELNLKALEKLRARFDKKQAALIAEGNKCRKALPASERNQINQFVTQIGGREGTLALYDELREAERLAKEQPSSETQEAVRAAFYAWQQKRDAVAKKLDQLLYSSQLPEGPYKQLLEIYEESLDLDDLMNEVEDQLSGRTYRDPKYMQENMYSLSSNLVLLSAQLDENPHTGCRSGKDRTSLQRVEVATKCLMRRAAGRYLNFRELEKHPLTFKIREQVLLNSGVLDELVYKNTGSVGMNLEGKYGSYLQHFGKGASYERVITQGVKFANPIMFK